MMEVGSRNSSSNHRLPPVTDESKLACLIRPFAPRLEFSVYPPCHATRMPAGSFPPYIPVTACGRRSCLRSPRPSLLRVAVVHLFDSPAILTRIRAVTIYETHLKPQSARSHSDTPKQPSNLGSGGTQYRRCVRRPFRTNSKSDRERFRTLRISCISPRRAVSEFLANIAS